MCFWVLPKVAESAYLSPFPCSWLRAVSACCALGGVSSGVNTCGIRHGEPLCTLHTYCDRAGSRKGHKPRFSLTETGLYGMSHTDFGELPFHALG
jgi:hypothetical protein